MNEIVVELLSVVHQFATDMKNVVVQLRVPRSDVWGPPIVAAGIGALISIVGWILVDRFNRNSNGELLQLQLQELARNRILDALDEYLELLFDMEDPQRVFLREGVLQSEQPLAMTEGVPNSGIMVNVRALERTIMQLTLFDSRHVRWVNTLNRDSWLFDQDQQMLKQFRESLDRHHEITEGFFQYVEHLRYAVQDGNDIAVRTIQQGRDSPSRKLISLQRQEIISFYGRLNRPSALRKGMKSPARPDHT